jgi:hypothetical protein
MSKEIKYRRDIRRNPSYDVGNAIAIRHNIVAGLVKRHVRASVYSI